MAIDPQLAGFVAGLEAAWPEPPQTLGAKEWRRRAGEMAIKTRPPRPEGVSTEDFETAAKGRRVGLRVYRPSVEGPLPILVYIHGGGWTIGSVEGHDQITAEIAARVPCVVVSVDYALAPENPYPAPLEDCIAGMDWVFERIGDPAGGPLAGATGGVFVGGDSAGGNLSAALTIRFRGNPDRPIAGQVLFYPVVDADVTKPSYIAEADAPFLQAEQMTVFWDNYCPEVALRSDPLLSPLRANDHTGLPPAFISVAEHDPVRDDGYAYAEALRASGVPVEFRPGQGLIHGFLKTYPFCDAAEAEYRAMTEWMRRVSAETTAAMAPAE